MTLCGYDDSVIVRILCVSDRSYVTPQVVYCVHPGQFSLAVETATSTVTRGSAMTPSHHRCQTYAEYL